MRYQGSSTVHTRSGVQFVRLVYQREENPPKRSQQILLKIVPILTLKSDTVPFIPDVFLLIQAMELCTYLTTESGRR
jgi:hypothetical protein